MPKENRTPFCTRVDRVVLALLTLAGIALSVWVYFPTEGPASRLEVRQNGRLVMTLPLDTDTEESVKDENGGFNQFRIRDGAAAMLDADCGDRTCLRTGSISRTGESIVCLPHRLVLQITSSDSPAEENTPDAIVH